MSCYRGHEAERDRQRRCIECRLGYDRARIGTPERRRTQILWSRGPRAELSRIRDWRRDLRRGMAHKESLIRQLEAQLGRIEVTAHG